MNPRAWKALRPYRVRKGWMASTDAEENNGAWVIRHPLDKKLRMQIIASDQGGWDHASMTIYNAQTGLYRIPFWVEMCILKDIFWFPNECVMQLHPAQANYVNDNENVLHSWKPQDAEIPLPPELFV